MFLDITRIPIEPLREKITEAYARRVRNEENFVADNNSHIACFIPGAKQFTGLFFIADNELRPHMCFMTNAYIGACTVSGSGKYAAIKTHGNPDGNADSDKIIILDTENRTEIARPNVDTPWDASCRAHIDENAECLCLNYGCVELRYAFDGKIRDANLLTRYYEQPALSPYMLDRRVNKLLSDVSCGVCPWNDAEHEVYSLLERLKANLEMSHYRLALTYKKLGEILLPQDAAKAMTAFETGLALNPKLPVKRVLGGLRKSNPDIDVPQPKIYSIEREKLWDLDDYVLPPTPCGEDKEFLKQPDYRENKAYQGADDIDRAVIDAVEAAFWEIGKAFIESMETDAYKFCKSIPHLNTMSDAEFGILFDNLCSRLDMSARKAARQSSERIIAKHIDDDVLTVREEIILNLHSIIQSYKGTNLKTKNL